MPAPHPSHEQRRLAELQALDVLDTPPEEGFDRVTRLAAHLFDVPIAMVSFTDADRQWNKSLFGIELREVNRDISFCAHAILSDDVLVVEDARDDARFANSTLVLDEPHVRFYAGAPLRLPGSHNLGTLCLMDRQPRSFSPDERARLRDLAALVVDELQHRRTQTHRLHLFEAHPQPMWIYDVETLRFLDVNAAAVETYGYSREEFLRMTLADIRPEADVPTLRRSVREAPEGRESSGTWRHLTRDGRLLDVAITSHPVTFESREARHVQVTDVTEQRQAERALYLSDAILKAAGTAADGFLRASCWETAIQEVLHRLGEAAEVDRVYLFENATHDDGKLRANQHYEWAAPGVSPQIDNPDLQNLSYDDLGLTYWVEAFRRHEPIHGAVDTLPEAMAELLRQQDVQALAVVPVYAGEHWWGFLGFDDCHRRETWSEPEIEALKMVAGTLGAAIHRQQTEAALREREESYRNLFDSVTDAIYIHDRDGRFLVVNQGAADMYGYDREDFVGETPAMLSAPGLNDLDAALQRTKRALEGEPQRFEWWGRRADGDIFPKEVLLNHGTYRGQPVVIATARDISERLKAEEQLRRIRKAVEQSSDGIIILSPEGELLYENAAQVELVGYTGDEVQALGGAAALYRDPSVLETVCRVMHEGGSWQGEAVIGHRNGHDVVVSIRADSIYDERGQLEASVVIHTDVTERREAEKAVAAKDEHLRLALEAAHMGTWNWDLRSDTLTWSDNASDVFGIEAPLPTTHDTFRELVHPEDRPHLDSKVRVSRRQGEDYQVEYRVRTGDGLLRWMGEKGRVFLDDDGAPVRMAGTVTDITARKQVRQRLAHLASYPELNPEPVVEIDREGRMTYVNTAGRTLFAEAGDELQRLMQELPTLFEAEAQNDRLVHEVALDQGVYELRVSHVPDSDLLRAYVYDVTERRRTDDALRASEARAHRLALVASRTINGVVITDPDGCIEWVNDGFTSITGYTLDEARGRRPGHLLQGPDTDPEVVAYTAERVKKRQVFEVELLNHDKSGRPYWVHIEAQPFFEDDGTFTGYMAIETDITERKEYEQQLIEAKENAEEMNRLKSAFLANMSHEIRTPLTAISGFAEILSEEVRPDNLEFVELIRDSSRRLMDTLNSILDLAQLESKSIRLHPDILDLNATLAATLQPYYTRAAERGLDLRLEIPSQPLHARLDPALLERILSNLVSNALKFTSEGHVAVMLSRDEQGRILLCVEDTGVGITSSFLPHIFEEFQQESSGLTRDYEGTGLGLTITKRLVGLMDGTIDVVSTKGEGSTFTVTLPGLESDQRPSAPAPAPVRAKPHVLVVEDNVHGGRLMQKLLEQSYDVDLVTSGQAALEHAERCPYAAVLMDISLGADPDGEEVMCRLRRRPEYASTPIVAVTAHALPGDQTHLLEAGFDAYVSKPFTRQEILTTLTTMLNSAKGR